MSLTASTSDHWLWRALERDAKVDFSDSQRDAIERVLNRQYKGNDASDIRLTFGRYYLVIRWGRERRSRERLADERVKHPVVTWRNAPVILIFWSSFLIGAYTLMALALRGLTMLFI